MRFHMEASIVSRSLPGRRSDTIIGFKIDVGGIANMVQNKIGKCIYSIIIFT